MFITFHLIFSLWEDFFGLKMSNAFCNLIQDTAMVDKKKLKGVGNSQDKSSPQTALLRAQKVASSVKAVICRGGGNATQFSRS